MIFSISKIRDPKIHGAVFEMCYGMQEVESEREKTGCEPFDRERRELIVRLHERRLKRESFL